MYFKIRGGKKEINGDKDHFLLMKTSCGSGQGHTAQKFQETAAVKQNDSFKSIYLKYQI